MYIKFLDPDSIKLKLPIVGKICNIFNGNEYKYTKKYYVNFIFCVDGDRFDSENHIVYSKLPYAWFTNTEDGNVCYDDSVGYVIMNDNVDVSTINSFQLLSYLSDKQILIDNLSIFSARIRMDIGYNFKWCDSWLSGKNNSEPIDMTLDDATNIKLLYNTLYNISIKIIDKESSISRVPINDIDFYSLIPSMELYNSNKYESVSDLVTDFLKHHTDKMARKTTLNSWSKNIFCVDGYKINVGKLLHFYLYEIMPKYNVTYYDVLSDIKEAYNTDGVITNPNSVLQNVDLSQFVTKVVDRRGGNKYVKKDKGNTNKKGNYCRRDRYRTKVSYKSDK